MDNDTGMNQKARQQRYSQLSDRQLGWFHIVAQWICIQILKVYFRFSYSVEVTGLENQPRPWQPYIVAANHMSSLDPPLVSVILHFQPIAYMAKLELFQTPLMRLYNWAMSSFAVNREKLEVSTVKTALRVLKHGEWALGIFPEGSRNKSGTGINELKKGVAYFAKAGQVPVLPIGIRHAPGKRIHVRVGTLIPPESDIDALGEKIRLTLIDLVKPM